MSERASAKTAVVKYESPSALTSRRIAVIATAFLIVFFPLPILYPFMVPIVYSGLPIAILLTLSIGSFIFFLIAFNLYRVNRNTRLVLTDTGIVLPGKGGELSNEIIPWSKVELIEVTESGGSKDESILFSLKGFMPIKLKLSSLSPQDLDKLVSACELWASGKTKDESFKRLVERVTLKRRDHEDSSFTALWMEEAQRRLSTTPFTPLEPGAELQDGRLKVVQPLTAGGWSAIYLCQWNDKSAILKEAVVPPTAKEELKAKAYEHFEREAILLAGLNHPQIAKVIDYFIENGRQYMVLERISGANLRSYVRDKGAVSERQAVRWMIQLANIVAYLHSQEPPIVHRDLTPENLVLDMKGSLVLIDFGSANEFVGTVTGTLVGKPSYISPEQFSGYAKPQSDLYSIGAVLAFMLTGKDPEPLMVAQPKESNPLVCDAINSLVIDMTQLDAKKRIQTVEVVLERLNAIAQEQGLEDNPRLVVSTEPGSEQ